MNQSICYCMQMLSGNYACVSVVKYENRLHTVIILQSIPLKPERYSGDCRDWICAWYESDKNHGRASPFDLSHEGGISNVQCDIKLGSNLSSDHHIRSVHQWRQYGDWQQHWLLTELWYGCKKKQKNTTTLWVVQRHLSTQNNHL